MTKRKAHPQKGGRKTSYKPEFDDMAHKFALLGFTDLQMSRFFGVAEKTFIGWKKRYPTFRQSIVSGKEPADAAVAGTLHERATGYHYMEAVPIKVKEVKYENGKRVREWERVEVTMVERVVPPDTKAIQYWMNNRRRRKPVEDAPEEDSVWADRHEIDHTTKGEKLPTPEVYLPADLPANIIDDIPQAEPDAI